MTSFDFKLSNLTRWAIFWAWGFALAGCGVGLRLNPAEVSPWTRLSGAGSFRASAASGPYVRAYSAKCSNGSVGYLFGGLAVGTDLSSNLVSDLWKFNGSSWTPLWGEASTSVGPLSPVLGSAGVPDPANGPGISARGHCAITSNGDLWLFGGFGRDPAGSFSGGNQSLLWRFRNGQWTYMAGPQALNSAGVYGALGVPSSSNYPGTRFEAAFWVDSSDRLWLFGGYGQDSVGNLGFLNDLWRYDTGTNQWVWLAGSNLRNANGSYGPTPYPGARYRGASFFDSTTGYLWLFGGIAIDAVGGSGTTNELWRFDGTNWVADFTLGNAATWLGNYSVQGSFSASVYPGPRGASAIWVDSAGDIWVFGGLGSPRYAGDNVSGGLNDLWRYRPALDQWQWAAGTSSANVASNIDDSSGIPQSSTPEGLAGPSHFFIGGQGYIFGGEASQTGSFASANTNRWWRWDGSNWAWLGGADQASRRTVSSGLGAGSTVNTPGPRNGVAATISRNEYWVFGGQGFDRSGRPRLLGDLWSFDFTSRVWTWWGGDSRGNVSGVYGVQGSPSISNFPGGRSAGAIWHLSSGLFLFGGSGFALSNNSERWLSDLWRFRQGEGWTWLKGSNLHDQTGVYGVQGVAGTSNTPGGRRSFAYWADAQERLYVFGGDGYTGTGLAATNELWRFDGTDWTWLKGSSSGLANGVYGTQGVPSALNTPGARTGASATYDVVGNRAIIFGGFGQGETGNGALSDLWQFSGGEWTWLAGSKQVDAPIIRGPLGVESDSYTPGPRSGAAIWVEADGSVFISGGSQSSGRYSDVWRWRQGRWAWIAGSSDLIIVSQSQPQSTPAGFLPWGSVGGISFFRWSQENRRGYFFGGTGVDGSGIYGVNDSLWQYSP